jgi:hypothetical protein
VAEAPPPRRELSAGEVWQDIADGLFSLERGLPHTFATLWWKPATQARRYVATRDPTLILGTLLNGVVVAQFLQLHAQLAS